MNDSRRVEESEEPAESDFVLHIPNRHVPSCGVPPGIEGGPECRLGYFENRWGEQFVLEYDPDREHPRLWGGDLGWGSPSYVKRYEGECIAVTRQGRPLFLSAEELDWLTCCVNAIDCELSEWDPRPGAAGVWEFYRIQRYRNADPHWSLDPAIKVFVSSPMDLRKERLLVCEVCEELSSNQRLPVVPLLWEGGGPEYPNIPSFTPILGGKGPQAVIDDYVWERIGGYDIYLGIHGREPGTPIDGFRSGTEAELSFAIKQQKETGEPRSILFYEKVEPSSENSRSDEEAAIGESLIEDVRDLGLVGRFEEEDAFKRKVKTDLTNEIMALLERDSAWKRISELLDWYEEQRAEIERTESP